MLRDGLKLAPGVTFRDSNGVKTGPPPIHKGRAPFQQQPAEGVPAEEASQANMLPPVRTKSS